MADADGSLRLCLKCRNWPCRFHFSTVSVNGRFLSSTAAEPSKCELHSSICSKVRPNNEVRYPRPKTLSVWPLDFNYRSELINFLSQNLLYANGGIYSFSKPYGISSFGAGGRNVSPLSRSKINQMDSFEDEPDDSHFSVRNSFATLSSMLSTEEPIQLVTSIPRYASGPVVAVTDAKTMKFVRGSLTRVFVEKPKVSLFKALVLCNGIVSPLTAEPTLLHAKVIDVHGMGQYDICSDEEYRCLPRNKMKRVVSDWLQYRVLGHSAGCSLLELSFNSFVRHLPLLFCLNLEAPVLGDRIYQTRIARILGKTVPVTPKSASLKNVPVPTELLKELKISLREFYKLPTFFHVYEIFLKQLHGKKSEDVFIRDPLPSHFEAALQLLDLRDCIEEK